MNYDLSGGVDQKQYASVFFDPEDDALEANKYLDQSYAFIKKHVNRVGSIMEIGCGNGRLLNLARNDGWKVKGLELLPYLAELVKNKLGIDVEVKDFMDYEVDENDQYDLILLRHVFEHIPVKLTSMLD